MSTYYYFKCVKCKRIGGFYSRQAGGWGNFDIIDSFKFLALHTDKCGPQYIRVISEHDEDYEMDTNAEKMDFYRSQSIHYFPSSNDWEFMRKNYRKNFVNTHDLWIKEETKNLFTNNEIKIKGYIIDYDFKVTRSEQYFYKAYIKSEDGREFTFTNMSKELPDAHKKYVIHGEVLPKNRLRLIRKHIGKIRGEYLSVFDMKVIRG
ncbi:hypothetical protein [Bacillus sp. FJAT-27445]|uniref:hypothetical protein n=1 Tax=Bacillus sp. FJAT-27445 TaxID=1679166 RepID=UPI0007442EB2|nr:hypothetical protein [Bacillus sp. FJAT-27445]